MFRTAALLVAVVLLAASVCVAGEPEPLAGGSLPGPDGLTDRSVDGYDASPPSFDPAGGGPGDFYNQKMLTVEGVVTAIDLDGGTITIKGADGENTYLFDELTRFQVRLRPMKPHDLKVGSKMAGLYRQDGDSLYIGRVIVITGEQKKRRRRR